MVVKVKKYNAESLRYMTLFSRITRIMPLECFLANKHVVFILRKGTAARAIGKEGKNIKQIKNSLKKEIKVVEQASSVEKLVENYLFPIRPRKVELEEDDDNNKIVVITFRIRGERQTLLGNNKQGLSCIKEIINHFYPQIKTVKIP